MINYRCIVLDHDDTVVRSSETVNHPAMLDALKIMRPGMTISYRDFMVKCYEWLDFPNMCKHEFGFTEEESAEEYEMWKIYVRTHIPPPYEGMKELLERYREAGGLICVSSHSSEENIARDYLIGENADLFSAADHRGCFWRKVDKSAYCRARLTAGSGFEGFSYGHKCQYHRRAVVIEVVSGMNVAA